MFETITVLGPGLLGASLLQAALDNGLCQRTVAWSRRPETRVKCERQPWCHAVAATAADAVSSADLVVVCTPVATIAPLIESIRAALRPNTLVTDVGSTKSLICRQVHSAVPEQVHFVGSHPMAGSEKTGMEHARADLFYRRACFVTPLVDTDAQACEKIVRFWDAIGMQVVTVNPEKHDEIVANISHLPHILASVLCSYLSRQDPAWLNYAGGGLKDTTRIASGDPHLWKSIIEQNRDEILRSLSGLQTEIDAMRAAIHNQQYFEVLNLLQHGKSYRDGFAEGKDGHG